MITWKGKLAASVLGSAILTCAAQGRAQQGPAEKVGEVLDNTGRAIKRGVQGAGATVREGLDRSRESVNKMEVASRVYSRLHWDKALNNATLDLEVQAGGITVLRGVVPDSAAKAKAVQLASDTVGVAQVVDEISVSPAPRVIPAAPAAPARNR